MDSLTHIVLGACIGEAVAGKKLRKKALFLGAIAQSVPDIDFITTFWLSESKDIISHRGFTHSILFAILATFILSWLCRIIFRKIGLTWKHWFLLFGLNIFVHIFIDGFNAYGIGWFEPFSSTRYSFHILYVADPLFSIWPFSACIILMRFKMDNLRRKLVWRLGIGMSVLYLVYAVINKSIVSAAVRKNLATQNISKENYIITPTPFNTWLWFVSAYDKNGYQVGYRSVFDRRKNMKFTWFPQNRQLLSKVENREELNDMLKFADGQYTLSTRADSVMINILRFGQVVGWYDPKERFAFYYFLDCPGCNEVVVQRGRFERWNRRTLSAFWQRIRGN